MNFETARNTLLFHSRSKKNGRFPLSFQYEASITNPICGDHVELKLYVEEDTIKDIGHKASACAVCSASASLLCEEVMNLTIPQALLRATLFENAVSEVQDKSWPVEIKNLICFEHLRVNTARRICALLPWTTLKKAFKTKPTHQQSIMRTNEN